MYKVKRILVTKLMILLTQYISNIQPYNFKMEDNFKSL